MKKSELKQLIREVVEEVKKADTEQEAEKILAFLKNNQGVASGIAKVLLQGKQGGGQGGGQLEEGMFSNWKAIALTMAAMGITASSLAQAAPGSDDFAAEKKLGTGIGQAIVDNNKMAKEMGSKQSLADAAGDLSTNNAFKDAIKKKDYKTAVKIGYEAYKPVAIKNDDKEFSAFLGTAHIDFRNLNWMDAGIKDLVDAGTLKAR